MNGAFAIARHEFGRRWPLVFVGLGLGILPQFFIEPDTLQLTQFGDTLVTIAAAVCWLIAFTSGLSLIGRPLHDGRLSFYFTRPITSAGIALGKILGCLIAIACMHVALAVPLMDIFVDREETGGNDLPLATMFVGVAFFVVGLVVGILARSRSRWFVADIAGAAIAAVVAVGMFGGFGARKAFIARTYDDYDTAERLIHRADNFLYAIVVVAAVALVVSVVIAIARGRTDRDLVHRGLSITLWPALTAIGLVGLALAQWGLQ